MNVVKFAYWFGRPSTTLKKVSLKEDNPVCNNRTSSNKLLSTITVLSYILLERYEWNVTLLVQYYMFID